MGHIARDTRTRAERTQPEWLKLGGQLADFVNERSGHDDILGFVGEGAGAGAAACYWPASAEIELDVKVAFGELITPREIGKLSERSTLFEFPRAAGAIIHEASHARWTQWSLEKLEKLIKERKPLLAEVIQCFEEPRIEMLAAETWPKDVPFLRASARDIVMGDLDLDKLAEGSPFQVARLMLLTVAREDAGVLEREDVDELESFFVHYFGLMPYTMFRNLWLKAIRVRDHAGAFEEFQPLAEAWLELLPEEPEMTEAMKAQLEELIGMVEEALDSAEVGGTDDAGDQEQDERWAAVVVRETEKAAEKAEHDAVAAKVFGKSTADIPDRMTSSSIYRRRPPTGDERAAAVIVAKALEKARYRDRVEIESKSEMPPGRLNTRDAIDGMAQRRTGQPVNVKPWQHTARKHVEDPNLVIGMLTDCSGSMNGAMEPMAVTNFVLAEAGYRVQARVAQVYFGNSAFPTLKPGQRMHEVIVRTARDGTERFSDAFKALNGTLNLLDSTGARLLIVCSDMCYTGHEAAETTRWITRCVHAGVGVLVLPFGSDYYIGEKNLPKQVQVITGYLDPAAVATLIGQAAAKALETASVNR